MMLCELLEHGDDECSIDVEKKKMKSSGSDTMVMVLLLFFDDSSMAAALDGLRLGKLFVSWWILQVVTDYFTCYVVCDEDRLRSLRHGQKMENGEWSKVVGGQIETVIFELDTACDTRWFTATNK